MIRSLCSPVENMQVIDLATHGAVAIVCPVDARERLHAVSSSGDGAPDPVPVLSNQAASSPALMDHITAHFAQNEAKYQGVAGP